VGGGGGGERPGEEKNKGKKGRKIHCYQPVAFLGSEIRRECRIAFMSPRFESWGGTLIRAPGNEGQVVAVLSAGGEVHGALYRRVLLPGDNNSVRPPIQVALAL